MAEEPKLHLVFTYGTLKRGFPNHSLMQSLIDQNDAEFLGSYVTLQAYPLVCGAYGIPFLINLRGSGHRVTGELYSVSTRGLVRVDELEGTRRGHYERLSVQVIPTNAPDGAVPVEAEAYYAHRSFGDDLWERSGREGMTEYTETEARGYVRIKDRPKGTTFLDAVRSFVSSGGKNESPMA